MPSRHGSPSGMRTVSADDPHVTLKVPQADHGEGQALPLQPPQVVPR